MLVSNVTSVAMIEDVIVNCMCGGVAVEFDHQGGSKKAVPSLGIKCCCCWTWTQCDFFVLSTNTRDFRNPTFTNQYNRVYFSRL